MMLIDGADNIRIRHNTSFNSGTALYAYGHAVTNFVLENNIVNYGNYGIMGDGASPGNGTLATWFPSAVVLGNVMPNNPQPWTFPAGNSYPPNWAAVGFVDLAGGNYRLASTSAYIAAGTGGSTPGADIDALEAAMVSSAAVVACTFTVTPLSHDSPAGGDTFNVGVTASAPSCSWTAASDQPWATASVAGGTGSGTLMLTVGANGTSTQRTATLTVAGSAVAITEDPPPTCTFTVTPASHDSPAGGDSFSVGVTASASACSWTASSDQPWATASAAGGTGSGTLRSRWAERNVDIANGKRDGGRPGLVITEAAAVARAGVRVHDLAVEHHGRRRGRDIHGETDRLGRVVRLERGSKVGWIALSPSRAPAARPCRSRSRRPRATARARARSRLAGRR